MFLAFSPEQLCSDLSRPKKFAFIELLSFTSESSPKICGVKIFDFRRITLFRLGYCLSRHKMTIYSKTLWGPCPLKPPWLRLWFRFKPTDKKSAFTELTNFKSFDSKVPRFYTESTPPFAHKPFLQRRQ